jgi:DNA-directed RNA polymerase subunit M/transcription elongation factor TFIIS
VSKWEQLRKGEASCFCYGCGKLMRFSEKVEYPILLKCSECGAEFLAIKPPKVKEGKHEKTTSR